MTKGIGMGIDLDLKKTLECVEIEARETYAFHGAFASAHEAWAVLYEEVMELFEEIRKKPSVRDYEQIAHEAIQVAAVATRFVAQIQWREMGGGY